MLKRVVCGKDTVIKFLESDWAPHPLPRAAPSGPTAPPVLARSAFPRGKRQAHGASVGLSLDCVDEDFWGRTECLGVDVEGVMVEWGREFPWPLGEERRVGTGPPASWLCLGIWRADGWPQRGEHPDVAGAQVDEELGKRQSVTSEPGAEVLCRATQSPKTLPLAAGDPEEKQSRADGSWWQDARGSVVPRREEGKESAFDLCVACVLFK